MRHLDAARLADLRASLLGRTLRPHPRKWVTYWPWSCAPWPYGVTPYEFVRDRRCGIEEATRRLVAVFSPGCEVMTVRLPGGDWAGMFSVPPPTIRLNSWWLDRLAEPEQTVTAVHEVAHATVGPLSVICRDGEHGPLWRQACRFLGLPEAHISPFLCARVSAPVRLPQAAAGSGPSSSPGSAP